MSTFLDYSDFDSEEELPIREMDDHAYVVRHMTDHRLLSAAEEAHYSERARAGDFAARDVLVRHNVRLVVDIAKHFRPGHQAFTAGGLEYGDLVQEGLVALTRAAERYEAGHGATFATYATTAIHRQIVRAITTMEDTIKIPAEVRSLGAQVRKVEERYAAQGLPRPTADELAFELEVAPEDVVRAKEAARVSTSLNKRIGEDEDTELIDLQPDVGADDFANELMDYSPREVREALSRLKPREREILVKRYAEGKDLKQIGGELGVSAERVRIQEKRAIGKARRALENPVPPRPSGGLSL